MMMMLKTIALLLGVSHALVVHPQPFGRKLVSTSYKNAASIDEEDLLYGQWSKQLQSTEVQQIRLEILNKCLDNGIPREEAERQVDTFLLDQNEAHSFIEMRRHAKSQDELVGADFFLLQLLVAFFVGYLATALIPMVSLPLRLYPILKTAKTDLRRFAIISFFTGNCMISVFSIVKSHCIATDKRDNKAIL
jgi:hypothetical protein